MKFSKFFVAFNFLVHSAFVALTVLQALAEEPRTDLIVRLGAWSIFLLMSLAWTVVLTINFVAAPEALRTSRHADFALVAIVLSLLPLALIYFGIFGGLRIHPFFCVGMLILEAPITLYYLHQIKNA